MSSIRLIAPPVPSPSSVLVNQTTLSPPSPPPTLPTAELTLRAATSGLAWAGVTFACLALAAWRPSLHTSPSWGIERRAMGPSLRPRVSERPCAGEFYVKGFVPWRRLGSQQSCYGSRSAVSPHRLLAGSRGADARTSLPSAQPEFGGVDALLVLLRCSECGPGRDPLSGNDPVTPLDSRRDLGHAARRPRGVHARVAPPRSSPRRGCDRWALHLRCDGPPDRLRRCNRPLQRSGLSASFDRSVG
jgi:hypothetical protein